MLEDIFDDSPLVSFSSANIPCSEYNSPARSLDSECAHEWNTHRISAFHSTFDSTLPNAIDAHTAHILSSTLPFARRIGRIRAKLLLVTQCNDLSMSQHEAARSALHELDKLQLSFEQKSSHIDSNADSTLLTKISCLAETANSLFSLSRSLLQNSQSAVTIRPHHFDF